MPSVMTQRLNPVVPERIQWQPHELVAVGVQNEPRHYRRTAGCQRRLTNAAPVRNREGPVRRTLRGQMGTGDAEA
jgi:hypothetical protein